MNLGFRGRALSGMSPATPLMVEFLAPFLAVTDAQLVSVKDLGPKRIPCVSHPPKPKEKRAFASI